MLAPNVTAITEFGGSYFVYMLFLNMSCRAFVRDSYATRLIFSLLPSTWYAKRDASINGLLQAIADDLVELFNHGTMVQVAFPN